MSFTEISENIKARFARLKTLGNEQIHRASFENILEINQIGLNNVNDLKAMTNTPGWAILEKMMMDELKQSKKGIFELAIDPEKNGYSMVLLRAKAETIEKIMTVVTKTIEKKRSLETEKIELTKTKRSI